MLYHSFSTQQEIDQQYNPRFSVENTDELIQSYLIESNRVSGEYANLTGVAYGSSAEETLDIFSTETPDSPIHIFSTAVTGIPCPAGILLLLQKDW